MLQVHSVFINVSKGQVASKDDLMKCFKTDDTDKVIQEVSNYELYANDRTDIERLLDIEKRRTSNCRKGEE